MMALAGEQNPDDGKVTATPAFNDPPTVTVGVAVSCAEQEPCVAKTLNIVVAAKEPVLKLMVPPVPATDKPWLVVPIRS